ncbi:hypothetical protein PT974_00659 [Cladobotryum mycophilum]|uniref:Peptidase A1 domain-containing protein n=1 Tax=Cladobotryum mycophilum TaxID=491253 RepID=A0ABR0T2S1_9HYPO
MRSNVFSAAVFAGIVAANHPSPVSLAPGDWLGIDGNWSTVKFLLGSPVQCVNVLVSTSLSEFWAVGPGGCLEDEPHCAAARGGLYVPRNSKRWSPMGIWQLGLNYLGYGGNGEYGLDSINAFSPATNIGFSMPKVLMSAINTTDYFIGLFGLGINKGTFGKMVAQSPLTQAVQTYGWIPSYSYSYTAGAYYRNAPASMTLGGMDFSRFTVHRNAFVLSADNLPRALVRGIQVNAPGGNDTKPGNWNSSTTILSNWDDSFPALIDSTTPFLWLPESICDDFAKAFNLTYNSTFELYTLTNEQYQDFTTQESIFNFTFSFSSIDNHDNFGSPLDVAGVVNITLPIQAFVSLLQYPYMNAIGYGDPAVPYFSLKKAKGTDRIIIGRSFLQEAYMITKYDSGTFGIYQAQFPRRPLGDSRLVPIRRPNTSPYPPPARHSDRDGKLTTGQMVGIVVGAVSFLSLSLLSVFCYCRRRHRCQGTEANAKEGKDSASTIVPVTPRSPVSQMFCKMTRKKRAQKEGSQAKILVHPSEAPDSEIYELPAPLGPVELDATGDDGSFLGETELGTDDTHMFGAYEIARMKIDRQLQGPVPEYSPPADGVYFPPEKKMSPEASPISIHPPAEDMIPVSPNNTTLGTGSLPKSLPSPVSPRSDCSNPGELPSPATVYLPTHISSGDMNGQGRPTSRQTSSQGGSRPPTRASRSNSEHSNTAHSQSGTVPPIPPMPFQKDPIDPTNIVCLGELPQSLQLLKQSIMASHIGGSDGRNVAAPQFQAESQPSNNSLGSNYTEDEDRVMQEMTRQAGLSMDRTPGSESGAVSNPSLPLTVSTEGTRSTRHPPSPGTAESDERLNGGDLVHIPQMAAKRYSWEEER